MLSLEFWSNEVQVIMGSMLGIIQGGSMVIMINILTIIAMVPSGFHCTSVVFVGNSLGEGNPAKAKVFFTLITMYAFFVCIICSSLLVIYKDWVAALFTTDLQLLKMVSQNLKLIAIFITVHSLGNSMMGALRGMGR
jgi:multidrug resistance protein, MATE family